MCGVCVRTYYVQHEVVPQTRRAVNPDQDAIFQRSAESNSQPVGPGAGPLVGWPVECDEASSFAKDVCCPSWIEHEEVQYISMNSDIHSSSLYQLIAKLINSSNTNFISFPTVASVWVHLMTSVIIVAVLFSDTQSTIDISNHILNVCGQTLNFYWLECLK